METNAGEIRIGVYRLLATTEGAIELSCEGDTRPRVRLSPEEVEAHERLIDLRECLEED